MVTILLSLVGILFILLIPGFLLSLIIFKELEIFERLATSIVFSIGTTVLIGLFLGATKYNKIAFGGINSLNIWISLVVVSLILFLLYFYKSRKLLN